ncbi:MAG: glycerophosphodiester phosphodiesterase family protein [Gammaproteobacteria bacterium]|nr:glycerophosphodiester phosphodiesterase family protein [Gammaproteobacteria bacterium]
MRVPQLVAHRGYPLHYPENTLIGIEAALAAGARYVEVDVQLTADRVPVLFHDRNMDRLCRAPGAIHEFTRDELRERRVLEFDRFGYKFAQIPITLLAELATLLARYPQATAFIEIKRIAVERFGVATVLEQVLAALKPVIPQCVLISYNMPVLLAAREQGYRRVGAILEKWHHHRNTEVQAIRPDYLFCDAADLPRFGDLGQNGAEVVVYEITDPQLALKLAGRGINFIETFAIGEMLASFGLLHKKPG